MMKTIVLVAAAAALAAGLAGCAYPGGGGHAMGGPMMSHGTGGPMMMGSGTAGAVDEPPGWSMMTDPERAEFRRRMGAGMNRADCERFMNEHHEQMAQRARERGLPPPQPHGDYCPRMAP